MLRYAFVAVVTLCCILWLTSACSNSADCDQACGENQSCIDGSCVDNRTDADVDLEWEGDIDSSIEAEAIPFITDEQGRVMILHGVNIDYGTKSNPEVLPVIPKEQAERLVNSFGLNFVRLLMVWEGVEPQAGVTDRNYLDMIEQRVDLLWEAGLYVVLDMHQDVYAQRFCCDGAPEWAIRDDDLPYELQDQWFLNYFQPAVQRSFDNFWAYDKGEHADLQDHYAAMWVEVAKRFKDHPAVLGYDLMNEPHPGSDFDAAEAVGLSPSRESRSESFDKEKLTPFYQRVTNAIRSVDTENWIFFESRYGGPGNGSASWIEGLDDPRNGSPRLAYFPHLYSVSVENNQSYNQDTMTTIPDWEAHRSEEVTKEGWPLLIGEWGLDSAWTNADLFMKQVLAMADRQMAGWAYWAWDPGGWSFIDSDLNERESADIIVRTYPRRIAGKPISFGFDPDTRVFELTFVDRAGVSGSTEIYLPAVRHYPDGWTVTVSDPVDSWSMEWDQKKELLTITTTPDADGHEIRIEPK